MFKNKKSFVGKLLLFITIICISCSVNIKNKNYIKTKNKKIFKVNYSKYLEKLSENDIIFSFLNMPQSLNPYRAYSAIEIFLQKALFSSLFDIDPKSGLPYANLIESYKINNTGTFFQFTLRKNIYFKGGKKLTTKDVVDSLSLLETVLKGTDIYKSFHLNNETLLIEKSSDFDFSITTTNPDVNLLYALSNFPILSSETVAKIKENIEEYINLYSFSNNIEIIGTGPYLIEKIETDRIILLKNPNYFKNRKNGNTLPNSKRIIAKVYPDKKKQIEGYINDNDDILSLNENDFKNLSDFYKKNDNIFFVDTGYDLKKCMIAFNCYTDSSKSFLVDNEFRKFIYNYSKNNNYKINNKLKFVDSNNDGVSEYKDGNTIFIRLIVPEEDENLIDKAESISKILKDAGLDVFVEKIPYHIFLEKLFYLKEYDIALFNYSFYPGIISYANLLAEEDLSFFPFIDDNNISSNKLSNLLKSALNSSSLSKQQLEIKNINKYLVDNYQLIPFQENIKYYIIRNNIYNFKINSRYENFYNLKTIESIIKLDE